MVTCFFLEWRVEGSHVWVGKNLLRLSWPFFSFMVGKHEISTIISITLYELGLKFAMCFGCLKCLYKICMSCRASYHLSPILLYFLILNRDVCDVVEPFESLFVVVSCASSVLQPEIWTAEPLGRWAASLTRRCWLRRGSDLAVVEVAPLSLGIVVSDPLFLALDLVLNHLWLTSCDILLGCWRARLSWSSLNSSRSWRLCALEMASSRLEAIAREPIVPAALDGRQPSPFVGEPSCLGWTYGSAALSPPVRIWLH